MRVPAAVMMLLVAAAGTVDAEDGTVPRTDCAWWSAFAALQDVAIDPMLPKLSYVAGVYDGLVFGKSAIRDDYAFVPHEAMAAALDRFCADEDNRRVPLVPALRVISMQLRGRSEQLVEQEIRRLRAQTSAPPP